MSTVPHLSKSRFTAGLQCHRQLWWRVHEPDAPELTPDAQTQAIFDQGTRVGELARTYVPGGTLIDFPYDQTQKKIAATAAALAAKAGVIYEASFSADRVFVAVDILERQRGGFALIEVKSSTSAKPEHLPDAAIQAHVLRQAGLEVRTVEIMHLNRECTFPDLSDLFVRTDVTHEVTALLPDVPALAREQLRMLEGPLPEVAIGPHCSAPRDCAFMSRCWADLPVHHVSTLYRIGRKAWDLEAGGCRTIHALPARMSLNPTAERQRRSVVANEMIVEPSLRAALKEFAPPLAFLDFETINPAIPVWDGCHPYDNVPVQFSCHRQKKGGGYDHVEWLADGPCDPRPRIAEALVAACAGARTIIAYNASFEKTRLRELGEALGPKTARAMEDITGRIVDLLPAVRDHVYHPGFAGSFSLKSVLPVLVPDLSYDDLEVSDGSIAALELARLLLRGDTLQEEEKGRLREALLRYCELDTWGTVRLLERLRELAGGA
jgi:predicted RecB family nuclease